MTLHMLDPRNGSSRADKQGQRPQPEQQQEDEGGSGLLSAPVIKLRLRACSAAAWRHYRAHHYKTQTLSPKARTFALTLERLHYHNQHTNEDDLEQHDEGKEEEEEEEEAADGSVSALFEGICTAGCPVGFVATIPQSGGGVSDTAPPAAAPTAAGAGAVQPGGTLDGTGRRGAEAWRAHRTVVLPAWQGLGIGSYHSLLIEKRPSIRFELLETAEFTQTISGQQQRNEEMTPIE